MKDLIPKDAEKVEYSLVYLPLAIPLFRNNFVPERGVAGQTTVDTIASLHSLAECWVENIVSDSFLMAQHAKGNAKNLHHRHTSSPSASSQVPYSISLKTQHHIISIHSFSLHLVLKILVLVVVVPPVFQFHLQLLSMKGLPCLWEWCSYSLLFPSWMLGIIWSSWALLSFQRIFGWCLSFC